MEKQMVGVAGVIILVAMLVIGTPRTPAPQVQSATVALAVTTRVVGCVVVAGLGTALVAGAWVSVSALYQITHRRIPANDGLFPLVGGGTWANVNPPAAQVAAAARGCIGTQPRDAPALDMDEQPLPWPGTVSLPKLLPEVVSLDHLVLGVTVDDSGHQHVVHGAMEKLVHVAVGGSSGFGKSVFLRALAYQLAIAREQPELVLIDLEGVTLAPFATSDRLLYPLADNEQDAVAVLSALSQDELNRRKSLFNRFPGVDSLSLYNQQANEPLAPIVTIIDEGTALLGDRDVENALKTLTLRARKYGLWVVLAGQDWKATSLDSAIRNQLSTRVQFRAHNAAQSRVLLGAPGAENLPTDPKGRALARLPGSGLVEMQTPYIGRTQITNAMRGGEPRAAMPTTENDEANLAARARALAAQGRSQTQIEQELFGYSGGEAYRKVKSWLNFSKN